VARLAAPVDAMKLRRFKDVLIMTSLMPCLGSLIQECVGTDLMKGLRVAGERGCLSG